MVHVDATVFEVSARVEPGELLELPDQMRLIVVAHSGGQVCPVDVIALVDYPDPVLKAPNAAVELWSQAGCVVEDLYETTGGGADVLSRLANAQYVRQPAERE